MEKMYCWMDNDNLNVVLVVVSVRLSLKTDYAVADFINNTKLTII